MSKVIQPNLHLTIQCMRRYSMINVLQTCFFEGTHTIMTSQVPCRIIVKLKADRGRKLRCIEVSLLPGSGLNIAYSQFLCLSHTLHIIIVIACGPKMSMIIVLGVWSVNPIKGVRLGALPRSRNCVSVLDLFTSGTHICDFEIQRFPTRT